MKTIGIVVSLILLSVGLVYFWGRGFLPKNIPLTPTSSLSVTPGEDDGLVNGTAQLGYTLEVPSGYSVEENGEFSRLYLRNAKAIGQGATNFLYISVVPMGKENVSGEIYNYSKDALDTLNKLQIGKTAILSGAMANDQAKYFTYKRIDDAMVGGYGAKVFLNEKPWEFPVGTTEYRYIIPFVQATYIIGGYVGGSADVQSSISKGEMEAVLRTLRLTPETVTTKFTSPIPEGEWMSFSDESSGIAFMYPSGWTRQTTSQNFPEGDLFSITAIGQSQRPQTELYDGVMFSVMKPSKTSETISSWMKARYGESEMDPNQKPEFSSVSFGGKVYQKVIVCGLGCFTYYHIIQNGKLYGFVMNAAGPHAQSYESTISKIMSSVTY